MDRRSFLKGALSGAIGTAGYKVVRGRGSPEITIFPTMEVVRDAGRKHVTAIAENVRSELDSALPSSKPQVEVAESIQAPVYDNSSQTLEWWAQESLPAEDSNLLLVKRDNTESWNSNGRARLGGRAAVGWTSPQDYRYSVLLALHECGHNAGLQHEAGEVYRRDGQDVATVMASNESYDDFELSYSAESIVQLREAWGSKGVV